MNKKNIIKIFVLLLLIVIGFVSEVTTQAIPLVLSDGTKVVYKGTNIQVEIPSEYEMPETYFRGVWVTPLAGCLPSYSNEQSYKREIQEMFDIMEYYNLNVLIYHVRIFNDALYPSKLNPKSSYMNTTNDMLEYVIYESHKRGIEFHAWLNPYRVKSSGGKTAAEEAKIIKNKCPQNIGSNPDNLLVNPSGGVILNPGLPEVRKFIVDTCMEIIENYDIDAIHFDDYFYITDVDDSKTREMYNKENKSLGDWRREQVDLFIEELSITMRKYNKEHNRFVQLGISPSGIWANGDGNVRYDDFGNAITSGSKTGGMEHYGNYLYSDTVNWINHEWIDYIMPQSYWAFTQPIAGYVEVMSWWDKVCARKKVNLYSGMGIYMSENYGKNYSWGFDPNEAPNQILYASTLTHNQGTVFYNINYLETAYKGDTSKLYSKGMGVIKKEIFTNPAILPVVRTLDDVNISSPKQLGIVNKGNQNILTFDNVDDAKFYVIYRSEKNITLDPNEVIAIIGNPDKEEMINFYDNVDGKTYNYAVRSQAHNNRLSDAVYGGAIKYTVTFKDFDGKVLKSEEVNYGSKVVAPAYPIRTEGDFVGWSKDFNFVSSDLEIYAKYTDSIFYVNFYNDLGEIVKTDEVKYLNDATAPQIEKVGCNFIGWDKEFSNVDKDLDVYPKFEVKMMKVKFVNWNDEVINEFEVQYGKTIKYPTPPSRDGYNFVQWSENIEVVTDDVIIKAIYEPIYIKVTFVSEFDNELIDEVLVPMYSDATPPQAKIYLGYEFDFWLGNYKSVTFDTTITAKYQEIEYLLIFLDINGNIFKEIEHYYVDEFVYPIAPTVDGYSFVKWDFDILDLNNDQKEITIKPIYQNNTIYTVTFVGYDGKVIETVEVHKGEDCVVTFDIPQLEGYTYIGFDKEITNVNSDLEVHLNYEKIIQNYGCKKLNAKELMSVFTLLSVCLLVLKRKSIFIR